MADLLVKIRVAKAMRMLQQRAPQAIQVAKIGMVQGMRLFESHIIKTQLSLPGNGPVSDEYGLRVKTGNARRSFFVESHHLGNDFTVKMGESTEYLVYHQWPKEGARPKRLHIPEEFASTGDEFIDKAIGRNLYRMVS